MTSHELYSLRRRKGLHTTFTIRLFGNTIGTGNCEKRARWAETAEPTIQPIEHPNPDAAIMSTIASIANTTHIRVRRIPIARKMPISLPLSEIFANIEAAREKKQTVMATTLVKFVID
jgi:hypothetical protein